jgi:integral membrane protein (TIGR00529 family)
MLMGMLPTPGGIMLSAPMVRELGDHIGMDRSRQAAINFFFRHQWESVWPLFPAVPLVQGIFGVPAYAVLSHNIAISIFGIIGGTIFLLMIGIPKKTSEQSIHAPVHHNLRSFVQAFWPILFTAILYASLNIPPAIGLFIAIIALMLIYRIPFKKCKSIFKSNCELDLVLLVASALLFKLTLETAGAVEDVLAFFQQVNLPPRVIIFFLPFLVASLIGVTMATVAITFPFLLTYIGTGEEANMYLATLAFCGLMCGLFVTPVHLCLPLSTGYFKTPLTGIIAKTLPPAIFLGTACAITAWLLG